MRVLVAGTRLLANRKPIVLFAVTATLLADVRRDLFRTPPDGKIVTSGAGEGTAALN